MGALKVIVRSAAELQPTDANGLSDPYVKAITNGQELRTAVKHETVSPVWEQTLEFRGTLQAFISQGLLLRVMDWDMVMFDDPLGDVKVNLDALRESDEVTYDELPLPTEGHISFALQWEPSAVPLSRNPSLSKDSATAGAAAEGSDGAAVEEILVRSHSAPSAGRRGRRRLMMTRAAARAAAAGSAAAAAAMTSPRRRIWK
mmetsp:Transcript_44248/g.122672  ORF Transcript_44248/g.122672 Transcript_44248/m.122672 type:complete len:202 (+) Transcript_44248:491-1096(+)